MNIENRKKELQLLKERLGAVGKKLDRHPAFEHTFSILEPLRKAMEIEAGLKFANKGGRFFLSCQIGLLGTLKRESQGGFIGDNIELLLNNVVRLMTLKIDNPEASALLKEAMKLLVILSIYLRTQSLGHWENLFNGFDPADIEKGGGFFQELGILFLNGIDLMTNAFTAISATQEWPLNSTEIIKNGGFLFTMLLLAYTAKNRIQTERILALLSNKYVRTFSAIEDYFNRCEQEELLSKEEKTKLGRTLQIIKIAAKKGEFSTFMEAIEKSLQEGGFSQEIINIELKNIESFLKKITELFAFAQAEKGKIMTSIIQTA